MKLFKTTLLFCFSLFTINGFSQDSFTDAFNQNKAQLLAEFLSESVDLSVLGKENIYSKKQAIIILQEFLDKDPCLEFEIKHQSKQSKTNKSRFMICEYKGTKNVYRNHFLVQDNGEAFQIIEIRIELEDD